jgi:superoxide dismutase, Cu-Zn family
MRLRSILFILLLVPACAREEPGTVEAAGDTSLYKVGHTQKAHAEIRGIGITGHAEFTEKNIANGKQVEINLSVKGLKPGLHGVHIHAIGKCDPDFDAAGGHFDPGPAGNTDPDANHPFHMGDVSNLTVTANGEGTLREITDRITLSDGPLSLFDPDGAALIIHENQDLGITGDTKSGVSGGPRVACAVIVRG